MTQRLMEFANEYVICADSEMPPVRYTRAEAMATAQELANQKREPIALLFVRELVHPAPINTEVPHVDATVGEPLVPPGGVDEPLQGSARPDGLGEHI